MKIAVAGADYAGLPLTILQAGEGKSFNNRIFKNLTRFKQWPDVIVAPRKSTEPSDVSQKIYIRDLLRSDE